MREAARTPRVDRRELLMLQELFGGTSIPVLEQVVNFAQTRHAILASNIANLDTPGYRTRDLSVSQFEERLREALRDREQAPESSSLHAAAKPQDPLRGVSRNLEGILRHDQANVGIDQQIAEVSKNQSRHNLALSLMTSQFRLLQTAVSERV
jgi:flagellar basal-body rod protein FlgB